MQSILSNIVSRNTLFALVSASALYVSTQAGFCAPPQWVTWDPAVGGNGHQYLAVPGFAGLNWNSANALAQAQGGQLASITSQAENDFVFSLINSPQFFTGLNGSGPAIGGIQAPGAPNPAAGWGWTTGEAWNYTNWLPGQPNDNPGPEDRLAFLSLVSSTPGPKWNDINQTDQNLGGYIVEVVPEPGTLSILAVGALALVPIRNKRK